MTCATSVGKGLLVATYVEPLAAGQLGDGCVDGVGVIVVVMSPDCVTVTGTLPALVVDALLRRSVGISIWQAWAVRIRTRELTLVSFACVGLPGLHQVLRPVLRLRIRWQLQLTTGRLCAGSFAWFQVGYFDFAGKELDIVMREPRRSTCLGRMVGRLLDSYLDSQAA